MNEPLSLFEQGLVGQVVIALIARTTSDRYPPDPKYVAHKAVDYVLALRQAIKPYS